MLTSVVRVSDVNDFNQNLIAEFRANQGVVGGPFEGANVVLLHSTGAKTGRARVNPLVYRREGGDFAIFASKGGAPTNPDWYHNLLANPRTQIEVGTETIDVVARVATGDERERIWEAQKRDAPAFAGYEERTARAIPVVILTPV
jgi:deazaflavin-dependent oxidoreductase (nitroreductase family)